ncbi:hypothetical protein G4O51_07130 [Candidatus Bathyarchaeota archaeon A05DMB-2]|nr:hypothetical protein [Candidatus Bathyarchaeota archaeon A05DMB-2]
MKQAIPLDPNGTPLEENNFFYYDRTYRNKEPFLSNTGTFRNITYS